MKLTKTEKEELKKELRKKEQKNKKILKEFNKRIDKNLNFSSTMQVGEHYEFLSEASVEMFCIACFDNKYNLIANKVMSVGNVNSCMTCKRESLIYALLNDAVNVVIFHNHPSGDATPSDEDIHSTKDLKLAFSCVGINLVDSLIITKNYYRSLHEYI